MTKIRKRDVCQKPRDCEERASEQKRIRIDKKRKKAQCGEANTSPKKSRRECGPNAREPRRKAREEK